MKIPRTGYVLSFLLLMLAVLMGAHLALLFMRNRQCERYEGLLFDRLRNVPEGSLRAREIRQEITNTFGGQLRDCTNTTLEYGQAADKYIAVILSLLTGAGVVSATTASTRRGSSDDVVHRLLDNAGLRRRDEDGRGSGSDTDLEP